MIYKKAYKIVVLFNNKFGLILIFKILKMQKIEKLKFFILLFANNGVMAFDINNNLYFNFFLFYS